MIRKKLNAVTGFALGVGLVSVAPPAVADWTLNMPQGVTQTSRDIYGLHMTVLWITVIIGILVYGAIFYSIVMHRKSRGVKPARFHHNTAVEVVWTTIPLLILIGMAIPASGVLIDMESADDYEMTVKITGYQWKWGYEYVGEGVSFLSELADSSDRARQRDSGIAPSSADNYLLEVDDRLVLPTDTKIRFLITSEDVIHSWWMPDFGWKKDAIPGFVNDAWTRIDKPGVYRGQCAELCGRGHAFMPIVVEAVPPKEFKRWLAKRKSDAGADAAQTTEGGVAGEPVVASANE